MKTALIYNPAAGSFRAARLDALLRAMQGAGFAVEAVPTSASGAHIPSGAQLVCVHGGDGTVRDCVQALGERIATTPICVAPSGTINLIARELGYPTNPARFAWMIAKAAERGSEGWMRSPLYSFSGIPIVACLSVGPDSAAVAALDPALKMRIGRYAYLAAGAGLWRNWPRGSISLTGELADGSPFEQQAGALFVSRAGLYAGPFRLSPRAGLASDALELVTMRQAGRRRTVAFGSAVALRLPTDRLKLAETRTVRRLSIEDSPVPIQIDGDRIDLQSGIVEPTGLSVTYLA